VKWATGPAWILAYGGLIHVHRETDLVRANGAFIDDDIDTWASPATLVYMATLELELFYKFGWTIRHFLHDGKVVFVQIIASCGHTVSTAWGKAKSSQPGIEIYPLYTIPRRGNETPYNVVRDLWQGTTFYEPMMFPVREMTLVSAGAREPLRLQLPNNVMKVMECLYGNWRVPSGAHAGARSKCFNI